MYTFYRLVQRMASKKKEERKVGVSLEIVQGGMEMSDGRTER